MKKIDMNRNMTHDMKKDTILNDMTRRLIRNGCTPVRLGAHSSSLTSALRTILLLLMMTVGVGTTWGQTDYSGVYYIANKSNYNSGTPESNWYWVPAKDPQANHYADAYFHNQYSTTNISGNNYDYTGDNYGDPEKPFVTTYKTGKVDNSIWIITPDANETSYYNIIHAFTGKYLVYEPPYQQQKYRKSLHLETLSAPGNNAKFEITGTLPGPMEIKPKTVDSDIAAYVYLSVSGGNQNRYNGTPSNDCYRKGLIGLWNSSTDDCKWYFEKAVVDKPTITNNYTTTNTFTITTETDATIYYTTDGTTPTTTYYTGTGTTSVSLNQTATMTVIKAIAKRAGDTFPSVVTTYEIPQCVRPVITVSGGTVTITCATEGATIYYTTDGNPANTTSINSSSSPVSFPQGEIETIRAIATSPGYVKSAEAQLLPPTIVHSSSEILNDLSGNYILADDFTLSASIGSSSEPFSGTIDGNLITRTFAYPLVAYADGATIKNIILKDVTISGDIGGDDEMDNVGAICNEARGDSRIYNCGVLGTLTETKDDHGNVTAISSTSTISGDGNVGSIVGLLDERSRVINCYSFANVSGGTMAAGIVGNNAQASTQSSLKTIVVNCMFYGDITGGTEKYPVYGGNSINNDTDDGINPYCYYRKAATFTPTGYNRSWPAEEKDLTRFEYYRSILNSNKKLCTWWVNGTDGTAPTDDDVSDVGIAKWVLDPAIAPYPILMTWGKYPSVINPSSDKRVDPSTKAWVDRADATDNWGKHAAPDTDGQILGTVSVTINAGDHYSGENDTGSRTINITAMDKEYNDYCYGKIQLPYYNEVFGNPNGADHAAKYAGNYTDWVVTGWEISGGDDAVNYNFADRSSYNGRIFAQGGYFYVPDGVESITITAHWGKAVYLANRGYSIDRVKVTAGDYRKADGTESTNFAPAGTVENTFQNVDVYDDLQNAIKALGTSDTYPTVYDQAIVLIGNHQVKNGGDKNATNSIGYNLDSKWHPFTIMSADFDFDNEPDYCLQLQFRTNTDRPGIQPVRFDFLPVVELGLAVRHDKNAYAIGIFVPQGHFEITETSFMRTTQFEWDCGQDGGNNRIANDVPVILNGGEFDQLSVRYGNGNRTGYFLLGGHLWFHRFGPGTHPSLATANQAKVKLCPVNVIGGDYPEFYLSGLYRADITPRDDQGDPFCFIDGGNFGKIYGAGYEKIKGNVTFEINHAIIGEFYGGGINGSNPIGGNIKVTINNSHVDKYCGGPVVGNMTGKTVTTDATGTTFGVFYGGGNGGNSYYRQLQNDSDQPSSHIGTWDGSWNWQNFNPLNKESGVTATYDDGTANKGFHAEYEFEVFNHSNGVPNNNGVDQITQRGFIRWIQFGITITGNVESTLTDCIVENNFYGGGNLATVDGTVTSTLTNTVVDGSVFGAGYSAAIPTFQVHDKSTAVFPSITAAGIITDGHIDYDSKVYEWTNELDGVTGHDADYMKAHPTYSKVVDGKTKWYCYTWNPLVNLGAVTGTATLNINGTTTVAESVYGGGEESNVNGNTNVNICAVLNGTDYSPEAGNPVISGNVFGGGKGVASLVPTEVGDAFECAKAMVGVAHSEPTDLNGGTQVNIGNGSVMGSIYGGGEVGRVEKNTKVTVGIGDGVVSGTPDSAPVIKGSVFGAGAGKKTHGYSALVRGNSSVTVQGNAKVERSVYGGGEVATVGRYNLNDAGLPTEPYPGALGGGTCTVVIRGYAEIGTDNQVMNNTETHVPDDWGHVFGAGKGILPYEGYDDSAKPKHMDADKIEGVWKDHYKEYDAYNTTQGNNDVTYKNFIKTLGLASNTDVTISGHAFVKGSVYGGSENGFVQANTKVTIEGDCQIGNGFNPTTKQGVNRLYTSAEWASNSLYECAHWPYVSPYVPYDMYADKYQSSGGAVSATDGHTYFGNVFGGGSGCIPYRPGKWFEYAGAVYGNTEVIIKGGHILTSVYGGNEQTNVGKYKTDSEGKLTTTPADNNPGGKCTIYMTGGTVGVPRTEAEIKAHPVTCYIFGAGKGDPRTMFNTWTNVRETEINISGTARIYGSTFGGGEDGHVIGNVTTNIGGTGTIGTTSYSHSNVIIGSTGTSGADGNIFGGGRGFSQVALTAGVVQGNVYLNIFAGKMLGSVFGGGRLASVGTYLVPATDGNYGKLLPETADDPETTDIDESSKLHGHIYVNISGGEIGATETTGESAGELVTSSSSIGEVFGGSKGSATSPLPFGLARSTTVTISETDATNKPTVINNSVYGGGEAGDVMEDVRVSIQGGTIKRDVYGGGALAHTNIGNWDATATQGAWSTQKDPGNWANLTKTSSLYTTTVSLTGGKVRDAYGGALGDADTPAYVYGDTKVDLNGTSEKSGDNYTVTTISTKGCIVERIFGCNNVNGTPKGKSLVYVHATQSTDQGETTYATVANKPARNTDPAAANAVYDVKAVYGGGNMAAYEPVLATATDPTEKEKAFTNVIIDGCNWTSIKQVYGGGNAASTPATKVTVNGTYEIFELFGGGNGYDPISYDGGATYISNPGANVGFYDYSKEENIYNTKDERSTDAFKNKYVYGTGVAALNVFGGVVHRVFGGSNTKGNVRKTAVTLLEEKMEDGNTPCCAFLVDEAYGGGKSAPMDAEAVLHMACIPGLKAAYGGAQEADIQDNVTLNITNGKFNRVFGGNNLSGTIRGSITVNIEETGCRPIIIGELYGGGNQAGYSKYGYKKQTVKKPNPDNPEEEIDVDIWVPIENPNDPEALKGNNIYKDPVVNVKSFTSIGEVYGGGLGSTATMVGSPHVNINVAVGDKTNHSEANIGENAKTYNTADGLPIPSHTPGDIGAINNVYGGGNEAKVIGDTYVHIGTAEYVPITTNIVVGETNVSNYYIFENGTYNQASGKAVSGTTYYLPVIGADIRGNVYGGGNAADMTGETHVVIGKETTE